MADPINLQFPMRRSTQGAFATNDTTLEAVADDLLILVLTNHGERPIHGDFGANLRKVIFEGQGRDVRQQIQDQITVAVAKWMPFVNLLKIDVSDHTSDTTLRLNEVHIKIEFSVGNIDARKVLSQRIRV